ncbi:restriction endonuclease subunit S [Hydrogenovibrio marinus]|uniref:Type I restriction modification DNA specificity domain-containing protein n=1 Tax=Hydrogenovibrio marinus TaxID=28885 RepID=A0A066ZPL6_HYDMR|nr:restriction endonuclease subunit S [Hydrogenovibrio marinus]KDN95472.1 hypothetical protein EI16_04000 [Hydrogenovibrio marinus]BBN59964.1 type-1 restriction enzyme EcoKI specificity protein [Hydrogenovibrio marinus]
MTEQQMQLPEGWRWKHYGDIAELIRGVSYKKTDASSKSFSGLMPILRANNIGQNLIFDDLVYVPKKLVKSSQQILENDIIVAMSSGSKHLVGKAAQANADLSMGFGAFCANLRVNKSEQIDARYVFYFYSSKENINRISSSSSGSNINNLKREHILNAPIPIAPIQQQKQIVAKIEELFSHIDAGVESLKVAKEKLKQYRQSVLKAAVTGELTKDWRQANQHKIEPADQLLQRILTERRQRWEQQQLDQFVAKGQIPKNDKWKEKYKAPCSPNLDGLNKLPKEWQWATFEQVGERVTVGHVGSMKNEYVEKGIPFLRSQNVRENRFDPKGLMYISEEFHSRLQKSVLEPGDLVTVRSGSVGVTCVIPDSLQVANCSDLIIVKQPKGVVQQFASFYMNTITQTKVAAQKVGVALTHFNTKSMAEMALPLPPMEEQKEIVRIVEEKLTAADRLMTEIDTKLTQAQQQKQTILTSAFKGELVNATQYFCCKI